MASAISDTILQLLPEAILVLREDGSILYANEPLASLAGVDESDLLGRHVDAIDPVAAEAPWPNPPTAEGLDARLERSFEQGLRAADGSVAEVEARHRSMDTPKGRLIVVSVRPVPADGGSGRPAPPLAAVHPVAVCHMTPDGHLTAIDGDFEALTGFDADGWIGRHRLELSHPEDSARLLLSLIDAAGGNLIQSQRVRVRHADLGFNPVDSLVTPVRDENGVSGLVCVMQPPAPPGPRPGRLTAGHMQAIFDANPAAMLVSDLRRCVVAANRAMCAMLGVVPGTLAGRPVDQLVPDDGLSAEVDRMRRALLNEAGRHTAPRCWHSEAGPVHTRVTTTLLRDEEGGPIGWLEVVEDIGDRHERERAELARRHRALELLSSLTKREQGIMQMAVEGATAPEIAQALFLSVRTVETHLARCYRKLGVRTRPDACRVYSTLVSECGPLPAAEIDLRGSRLASA